MPQAYAQLKGFPELMIRLNRGNHKEFFYSVMQRYIIKHIQLVIKNTTDQLRLPF